MPGNVRQIISNYCSAFSSYTLGGRRGLAPGLTTGALMCTLLQWGFNEINIFRIRHVSANPAASSHLHGSVDAGKSSLAEHSRSAATQPTSVESHSPMDRVLSMFGQRVSDEKYLERLRLERDAHLRRIAELEEKKKQ